MNRQTHRLFFALLPDPPLVPALAQVADNIKAMKLIRASWVAASKYHITLHFLGDFPALPPDIVDRAKAAASSLRHAPFDFVLGNVASFRGRLQSPCVLRCARDSDVALQSFWSELGHTLIEQGLGGNLERRFTPHVTIAYADKTLPEPIAIQPIVWTASSFVLVESLVGKSIHNRLQTWPLDPVSAHAGESAHDNRPVSVKSRA
ncbi:MAG: RNA 2',3'-cyclic phosphodiesterase [Rudaea sp.]|nr:RNA 2',3'-cyclic phosphodiesterase [Rudaea sp.]